MWDRKRINLIFFSDYVGWTFGVGVKLSDRSYVWVLCCEQYILGHKERKKRWFHRSQGWALWRDLTSSLPLLLLFCLIFYILTHFLMDFRGFSTEIPYSKYINCIKGKILSCVIDTMQCMQTKETISLDLFLMFNK